MLPSTPERVTINTSEQVNDRIRFSSTQANVARLASAGPDKTEDRLAIFNKEWGLERVVETLAPTGTLLWLWLGLKVNRKLLVIPALIQGFVLVRALLGWFPPLPLWRYLGIRTTAEIDKERNALKAQSEELSAALARRRVDD